MNETDKHILQLVNAVAVGKRWGWVSRWLTVAPLKIAVNQSITQMLDTMQRGYLIELVDEPWDWAAEGRFEVVCWMRMRSLTDDEWTPYWTKSFIEKNGFENAYGYTNQFVVPDPLNPDQPPPDDWSPEKYRRVVE